jgi:hypothetical protein
MRLLRKVVATQIQQSRKVLLRLTRGAVERRMIYPLQLVALPKVYWQEGGQNWSDLLKKAEGWCQLGLVGLAAP